MKTHPIKGAAIMSAIPQLADVIPGMKYHHEKWGGGGYPEGSQGRTDSASGADRHRRRHVRCHDDDPPVPEGDGDRLRDQPHPESSSDRDSSRPSSPPSCARTRRGGSSRWRSRPHPRKQKSRCCARRCDPAPASGSASPRRRGGCSGFLAFRMRFERQEAAVCRADVERAHGRGAAAGRPVRGRRAGVPGRGQERSEEAGAVRRAGSRATLPEQDRPVDRRSRPRREDVAQQGSLPNSSRVRAYGGGSLHPGRRGLQGGRRQLDGRGRPARNRDQPRAPPPAGRKLPGGRERVQPRALDGSAVRSRADGPWNGAGSVGEHEPRSGGLSGSGSTPAEEPGGESSPGDLSS